MWNMLKGISNKTLAIAGAILAAVALIGMAL